MKALVKILTLLTALSSLTAGAQQSHQFNDYTVHYNALNSSLISPGVAKTYNIRRSDSRALVNIAVLKDIENQLPVAAKALVTVSARNLTGQNRQVKMREIIEGGDAIYYIGELPVHNLETYRFNIQVAIEGEEDPLVVKFKQQFFTE